MVADPPVHVMLTGEELTDVVFVYVEVHVGATYAAVVVVVSPLTNPVTLNV